MQSRPAELLAADRARLVPRFETYRLRSLDPDTDVRAFPLPGQGATQSRVSYNSQQLGFREVRARIAWNHLEASGRRGVYVDTEWNVVAFELDDDLVPSFKTLAALPPPIASEAHVAEYPRALPLKDSTWAVSTGSGSLYILTEHGFTARYDLQIDGALTPFLLYAAHGAGSESRLLLARAIVHNVTEAGRFKPRQTTFELLEVVVDVSKANAVDDAPAPLAPSWRLPGPDLPYYAVWADDGWLVLSEEPFGEGGGLKARTQETPEQRAARKKEEAAAKRGLGAREEKQVDEWPEDAKKDEDVAMAEPDAGDQKYNFRWTQDQTSVIITIPLASGVQKSDIKVDLQPASVMFAITSETLSPDLSAWLNREHSFWSEIRVSESTWTFDGSELELTLAKTGDDMRWASAFVPADSDDEDDVPETFDAATLESIRASFSRAQPLAAADGEGEPHGNAPTIPALLREEMDMDSDDDLDEDGAFADLQTHKGVGRLVVLGHIAAGVPTWSRQPATVLSLPLCPAGDLPAHTGIIVKQAVDGLVFAPPPADPTRTPWIHLGTNPALAFVISSKRDLRLVRHLTTESGETTVLALDSGSGTGTGNAYVYYPPEDAVSARQGVVGVSGGPRGALLGVSVVKAAERDVAVALCENALVVLGGVV